MARTQLEKFPNLVTMFLTRASERGDKPFLWAKRGCAWQSINWSEAARQVAALAAGLQRIGLKPGDRVMLVSENRPEWLIADLGDDIPPSTRAREVARLTRVSRVRTVT